MALNRTEGEEISAQIVVRIHFQQIVIEHQIRFGESEFISSIVFSSATVQRETLLSQTLLSQTPLSQTILSHWPLTLLPGVLTLGSLPGSAMVQGAGWLLRRR